MYSAVMRLRVLEIGVLGLPVVALLLEQAGQIEQIRRAGPVIEPDHAEQLVLPAELAPVAQGPGRQLAKLILQVSVHDRNHARIAGDILVLGESLEHHDARPPVVIGRGTDHSIRCLVVKRPVNDTSAPWP